MPTFAQALPTFTTVDGEFRVAAVNGPGANAQSGLVPVKNLTDYLNNNVFVNVKNFGAKGDGITDDTNAIQEALNVGGAVFFPQGKYRLTASLIINKNGVQIFGSGIGYDGNGTILIADGNFDIFRVGYQPQQIWGFSVNNLWITGTASMIDGRVIAAKNVVQTSFHNVVCTDLASFAYLRQAYTTVFEDVWFNAPRAGNTNYGIYWDGSVDRSDLLTLRNFTYGNSAEDTRYPMSVRPYGLVLDGDVNTVSIQGARFIGVRCGILVRNTGNKPTGQQFNYLFAYDLEIDYSYEQPIRLENGSGFQFTDIYINTGNDPENAIWIGSAVNRASFKSGQVYGGRHDGIVVAGSNVSFIDIWASGGSLGDAGIWSEYSISSAARGVSIIGGFAGSWDHVPAITKIGVSINGAQDVRLVGVDLQGNIDAPYYAAPGSTYTVADCPGANGVSQSTTFTGQIKSPELKLDDQYYLYTSINNPVINFASNTYEIFNRNDKKWSLVIDGDQVASIDSNGDMELKGNLIDNSVFVNVQNFGAKGDGVTIDGPALQAAFDYAASIHRPVVIPNTGNSYLINQRLIIPNGLDLQCEPGATIKIADNSIVPNNMFWGIGNEATISSRHTGTRIANLTLDCNRDGNPDYGAPTPSGNSQPGYEGVMLAGMALSNIDGLVVEGCTFKNSNGSGLWVVDCPAATVQNNNAEDCRFDGISIRQYQWTGPLPAGLCTGNRLARCTVGIHPGIFGLTAGNFFGNYAEDCSDRAKWPASLYDGTYPNVWPKTGPYKHYGDPGYVSPAILGDGAGFEYSGYFSGSGGSIPPGADREQHIAIGPNVATRCEMGLRLEQGAQYISVAGGNYFANITANVFLFSATNIVLAGISADQGQSKGIVVQSIVGQDQTTRVSVVGCSARDNGDMALLIAGASHVNVIGGQYGGSGGGTGPINTEICITSSDGFYCSAVTVRDLDVESNAASWIYSDSLTHTDIEIIDCQFRGSPTSPIAGPGAANIVISGCGGIASRGVRRMGTAIVPELQVGTANTLQILQGTGSYGPTFRAYGNPLASATSFDNDGSRGWDFTNGTYAALQLRIAGPSSATAYPEINGGAGFAGVSARPQGVGITDATLVLGRSGAGIVRLDYSPDAASNSRELATTAWVKSQSSITAKYVYAGIPSDNGSGGYVADNGGVYIGGATGVWLKQEGFIADYEQGSWAAYPMVPNRWCGLSINPSGDPWNLPTENVTSMGLQLLNGASEERFTITAKWFGDQITGGGEYRIAPVATGTGRYWPITIGNNDTRQMSFGTDQQIAFTNETYSGTSAGNTAVLFYNPGATTSFRAFVRTSDGATGFEVLASSVAQYEFQLLAGQIRSTASIFQIDNNQPQIFLRESDQGTDAKLWSVDAQGGEFRILAVNDGVSSANAALRITRSADVPQNLILFMLPTSASGLPSGALWRDTTAGGTIKQVP